MYQDYVECTPCVSNVCVWVHVRSSACLFWGDIMIVCELLYMVKLVEVIYCSLSMYVYGNSVCTATLHVRYGVVLYCSCSLYE